MEKLLELTTVIQEQWAIILAASVLVTPFLAWFIYFLFSERLKILNSKIQNLKEKYSELESSKKTVFATNTDQELLVPRKPFELNQVVNSAISAAAHSVFIVGYWLPQWVENRALRSALENGARVTLILAAKDSPFLSQRSADLEIEVSSVEKRHEDGQIRLGQLKSQVKSAIDLSRLEILSHNSLPPNLIIQCDDKYYVGFYFHGESVSDNCIIEAISRKGIVGSMLEKEIHFLHAKGVKQLTNSS
jgi:hypothetical protein